MYRRFAAEASQYPELTAALFLAFDGLAQVVDGAGAVDVEAELDRYLSSEWLSSREHR